MGNQTKWELGVQLRNKNDVTKIINASGGKGEGYTELSSGAVMPNGISVKSIETLAIAGSLAGKPGLATFVEKVNSTDGGVCFPANATVVIGIEWMRKVPHFSSMLPMHFLVLARAHGFELHLAVASEALRILSVQSGSSKRLALKKLVKGQSTLEAFKVVA